MEGLLFLSGQPLTVKEICQHTGWTADETATVATELKLSLEDAKRGLTVLRVAGGYQLVTKPMLHPYIQWVRTSTTDLTPMALEVLAIIAFKQPITRAEIEKLRGVSSERVLNTLMQEGLITELGRKEGPGRPIIYGTTPYFLECMGMNSLADLQEQTMEEANGTVTESHE